MNKFIQKSKKYAASIHPSPCKSSRCRPTSETSQGQGHGQGLGLALGTGKAQRRRKSPRRGPDAGGSF